MIHDFINMSHQKHSLWNASLSTVLRIGVIFCLKLTESKAVKGGIKIEKESFSIVVDSSVYGG